MGLFDEFTSFENLEALNAHWKDCDKCVLRLKNGMVCPGLGSEKCVVMVVGRSPTKPESVSGRGMMSDRGGAEIRRWFSEVCRTWGIKPDKIYFTNIVKCPATVRDPNKPEFRIDENGNRVGEPITPAKECSTYIEEEIALIQPKLIISIGDQALKYFADRDKKIPSSIDKARRRIWRYRNSDFISCSMPIIITDEQKIPVAEDKQFLRKYKLDGENTNISEVQPTSGTLLQSFIEVENCTQCNLCTKASTRVFGNGLTTSPIMFVGEAPGRKENDVGAPFVGAAGQFMWSNVFRKLTLPANSPVADQHGRFDLKRVYMTNAVKCWPGEGNPNPTDDQMDACSMHLQNQIRIVDPKVIVCLGAIAARAITGMKIAVGKMRGRVLSSPFSNAKVILTWHPSFAMRQADGDSVNIPCQNMIDDISKALELAHAN